MRVRSFEFEAEPCEPLTPASVVNRALRSAQDVAYVRSGLIQPIFLFELSGKRSVGQISMTSPLTRGGYFEDFSLTDFLVRIELI
jgi:hypothetical protein